MVVISMPNFDVDDDVYIEELLVCYTNNIVSTIKAKLNFMQYIILENIKVQ